VVEAKSRSLPQAALRAEKRLRTTAGKPGWLLHVEYGAAILFRALFRALPLSWAYRLTEGIATVVFAAVPRYARRARAGIEIAYGAERSAQWCDELYRRSIRYQAWSFADFVLAPRLLLDERRAAGVDLSELDRALRASRDRGENGALLVASHQGTPEVGFLAAARGGWPHAVVARPFDNPRIWRAMLKEREPFERDVLAKRGALRPAYRRIKGGGIVALQIDQDAGSTGIFVPYFGTLASTHAGAGTLATTSGAPVFAVACVRTAPREFRYKILCKGPFYAERSGDAESDVRELTVRLTAAIESMDRQYPEQMFWVHRRWKSRPADEGQG